MVYFDLWSKNVKLMFSIKYEVGASGTAVARRLYLGIWPQNSRHRAATIVEIEHRYCLLNEEMYQYWIEVVK